MLHSLLLWLARAESQRYMVNIHDPNVDVNVLQEHRDALQVCVHTPPHVRMLSLGGAAVRLADEPNGTVCVCV